MQKYRTFGWHHFWLENVDLVQSFSFCYCRCFFFSFSAHTYSRVRVGWSGPHSSQCGPGALPKCRPLTDLWPANWLTLAEFWRFLAFTRQWDPILSDQSSLVTLTLWTTFVCILTRSKLIYRTLEITRFSLPLIVGPQHYGLGRQSLGYCLINWVLFKVVVVMWSRSLIVNIVLS